MVISSHVVDGVHRRFAHDINLFAACSVFDPALHSSFDGPTAAKYLAVLAQEKYFPDFIDSEVFASANAYFADGDGGRSQEKAEKAEKADDKKKLALEQNFLKDFFTH